MDILHVVGARPNFMKAAPVMRALAGREGIRQTLVHSGQHYDAIMSDVFFQELDIPWPDVNLEVGSGSHASQTAEVMAGLEPVVLDRKPDLTLVYGDVNSTLAAALVCAKLSVPVGHVEAGLRSFDRTMPEEINRLLTDQVATLLFTPSREADENLSREGASPKKIHFVGNVMIDSLVHLLPKASTGLTNTKLGTWSGRRYGLVTLHRPSNVDEPARLAEIVSSIVAISREIPLIFPVHPRTRQRFEDFGLPSANGNLELIEPLGYLDFLALEQRATFVITDSGGIQEETTFLGVPCLTLRDRTERPVTVTIGTNTMVGQDAGLLRNEVAKAIAGHGKRGKVPELWDGHAAKRIGDVVMKWARIT